MLLISSGYFTYGQKEMEIFKKKSSDFPQFKYDKSEFDSLIIWNRQMTVDALNGYYSAKAKVTFVVDTAGNLIQVKLADFEMQHIDGYVYRAETPEQVKKISDDLKAEAIRLIELTSGLWTPAQTTDKASEQKMFSYIYFSTEKERDFSPNSSKNTNPNVVYTSYLVRPNEGYKQSQLFNAGERRAKDNKSDLAAVYYKQAVRYNENRIANMPGNVDAYNDMGICYSKLNDMSNACKCWKTCLDMGDASAQALIDKYCK